MPGLDDYLSELLSDLSAAGLLRSSARGERSVAEAAALRLGRPLLDAASNDYLGFALAAVSRETDVQGSAGSGASRLVHGTAPEHLALESEVAQWVGLDTALLFSSGFAANVGLLQALGGSDVSVVSDRLNHASIVDGCRLSGARVNVVPHLERAGLERALVAASDSRLRLVVTESYFSMDGDGPDLQELRALCDRLDACLVVDEAHALGVFGPGGAGRCAQSAVVPDVLVGTLGKAVGVQGAFVAGSAALREVLWNRARTFVFSTAPSPALCSLAWFHVQRTRAADRERERLMILSTLLREELQAVGSRVPDGSFGPIVPVLLGDERRALHVASAMAQQGILVQAIRPPTVPAGTSRLRLTAKANWRDDDPKRVAQALASALHGADD